MPRSEPTRPRKLQYLYAAQAVPKHPGFPRNGGSGRRGVAEPCGVRPQRVQLSALTKICSLARFPREGGICRGPQEFALSKERTKLPARVVFVKPKMYGSFVPANPTIRFAGGLRYTPPRPYVSGSSSLKSFGSSARPEPPRTLGTPKVRSAQTVAPGPSPVENHRHARMHSLGRATQYCGCLP